MSLIFKKIRSRGVCGEEYGKVSFRNYNYTRFSKLLNLILLVTFPPKVKMVHPIQLSPCHIACVQLTQQLRF